MKILPKLTLTFLAVSLVPFSVGSAIAHYNVERALEREALRHLSALAAIKHSQLTRLGQEHLDQVSNVPSYGVAAALLADPAFSADLDQVVRGYAGLGRTGEACVAARSPEGGALFLHALRFDSRAALRRTLKASESQIPMNRALRREELAIPDAVDYRGVPVLAATRYVEGLGWGLVVKIDKAEALQTLYTLRAFLLALFLAIAGLAVAASVTISRRITTPIARLTAAASAIRLGEQGVRLNLPEKDEIGVLARTIERMADSPIEANSDFERKVSERTAELAATNAELEQFAYVASHDLQEPLRIVTSYVRLLQRRYRGQLDSDADEFIEFAADAATRMRQLIEDLLAYSRVERPGPSLEGVDLGELTREAIRNLKAAIDETEACVLVGELPVVPCRRSQLLQVLQNLISNALKY
ncbi:MAG: HAMP domain-containing protein, partial [Candidatus Sericytochromatia bacterium]|nr:HAMP domain-containing protein [Candidatus Tanganyikabacteria bacterium]